MQFIMGEDWTTLLQRMSYRGVIGFFYDSTWGGVLTYLICGLIAIFAVIGVIAVIKWLFFGRKKKDKGVTFKYGSKIF